MVNRQCRFIRTKPGGNWPTTTTTTEKHTSVSAAPVAATATVTTTVTAVAAAAAVSHHLLETRVDLLLGLLQHIHEVTGLLSIWELVSKNVGSEKLKKKEADKRAAGRTISGEEGDGRASGTSTTGPANPVDVVLRVVGVVIVDDVSNVAHVFMTEGKRKNLRLACSNGRGVASSGRLGPRKTQ